MRACSVDLNALRKTLRDYIDTELDNLVTDGRDDAKPTAGFQRVIQRAVIHVQSSGREEVTGARPPFTTYQTAISAVRHALGSALRSASSSAQSGGEGRIDT